MGPRMYLLRQHTWRRNQQVVTSLAVSDDPSLLEERAQGVLPAENDDLLFWTEDETNSAVSIRYSSVWRFGPSEHFFSIMTIPHLTRE